MKRCRATIQSDAGTELCQGKSGHRWHFYKTWDKRHVIVVRWRQKASRVK